MEEVNNTEDPGINLDWVSFEVKAMNGMFDQPPQQPRSGFPGRPSQPVDQGRSRDSLDNVDDEPPPLKVMKMDPKVPEDFEFGPR